MRDILSETFDFRNEMEYPLAGKADLQSYGGMEGWKGKLVYMSPEKFLRLAAPLPDGAVNRASLQKVEDRMKNQLPLDFCVLEVDMKAKRVTGHEGRHRCMAAKKLGIEKVPVLIYVGSNFARVPSWDKETHDVVDKAEFLPQLKEIETQPTDTFKMYHGGKRWTRIPSEFIGSVKGRYEAGPGIYFTNDYNTARKYAKGSRVVHVVEIDKNFKELKNINVPLSDVVNFVKNCGGMRRKNEIVESLNRNAERMKRESVSLDILNNLVVNYEAGAGNVGIQIANYFVSKGADAHLEPQSGQEFWLVVFNPRILKKVDVVDPKSVTSDFEFMLPKHSMSESFKLI